MFCLFRILWGLSWDLLLSQRKFKFLTRLRKQSWWFLYAWRLSFLRRL